MSFPLCSGKSIAQYVVVGAATSGGKKEIARKKKPPWPGRDGTYGVLLFLFLVQVFLVFSFRERNTSPWP
jgi:hypothetical protein